MSRNGVLLSKMNTEKFVLVVARFVLAARKALAKKYRFFGLFALVFLVTLFVLARLDFLPNAPVADAAPIVAAPMISLDVSPVTAAVVVESPMSIAISKIDVLATVSNPTSTDISVLDEELLSGAVRYPTSAKLGEDGNVVIFGHSSYLPVVRNQAYKTFDGIQDLVKGDTITVSSEDRVYTYAVRTVSKEDANSAAIPLSVSGKVLTLATCDSFGTKTSRFVVTADFVESHLISG